MALLDLQVLETPEAPAGAPPPGSRSSKGCGNTSGISLILC
ncbi:MAG: SapB/AmfS family lanthipeptide [Actinomycetota bacterium]|nr:SapB/AmfS family lanthipeptide [Actinomycetota bacterium]